MRWLVALVAALAVGLGVASGVLANKIAVNKADQASAVAALLKLKDLPAPFTWKGGKIDTSAKTSAPSCKGYHPKDSDLVTTGKATATFTAQGVQLVDQATVLESSKMVSDDFKRTFVEAFVPCLVQQFSKGASGVKILRAGEITFPKVAKMTAAYRILFTIAVKGKPAQEGALDLVAFGAGRKELSFTLTAIFGAAANAKSGLLGMASIESQLSTLVARRALGTNGVA